MNSMKFFEDNIKRINPATDPVLLNLNKGLLALAQEQQELHSELQKLKVDLRQVAQTLQQLRTR